MQILHRHKSGAGKIITQVIIIVDEPHTSSLSSLLLLNNYYLMIDEDYLNENGDVQIYLDKRHKFLNEILNRVGLLRCHYCGKMHLEVGERLLSGAKKNNANPNLATIDHVIPVQSGIDKLDESNWVVACKRCNQWKGNMSYAKFIKKLPSLLKVKKHKKHKKHKNKLVILT